MNSAEWYQKAKDLNEMEFFEEALEANNEALKIEPANYYFLAQRSIICGDMGDYDECEEFFNEAIYHASKANDIEFMESFNDLMKKYGINSDVVFTKPLDSFVSYDNGIKTVVGMSMLGGKMRSGAHRPFTVKI